jgi:23S rRNA A2030 N6-methylase RlmJ
MYDHSRKAGNAADVWKHFWFCEVLNRLQPAPSGRVSILDTHCGTGLFQRDDAEQWDDGIGRFTGTAATSLGHFGRIVTPYLQADLYPGSWLLAADVLKSRNVQFQIHGCDIAAEPERAFQNLGPEVALGARYQFTRGDGYPVAARGEPHSLVFFDPPYSPAPDRDWQSLARVIPTAASSADVIAVWYPLKESTEPCQLLASCNLTGHEITWGTTKHGMAGCGFGIRSKGTCDLTEPEGLAGSVAATLGGTYSKRTTPANGDTLI